MTISVVLVLAGCSAAHNGDNVQVRPCGTGQVVTVGEPFTAWQIIAAGAPIPGPGDGHWKGGQPPSCP